MSKKKNWMWLKISVDGDEATTHLKAADELSHNVISLLLTEIDVVRHRILAELKDEDIEKLELKFGDERRMFR